MTTLLLFAIGIIMIVKANLMKRSLDKYEFENRTDGGVIKFIDYNAKKSHDQKHGIAKLLFSAGLLLVVAGIIAYFA